jgi:hypothetical protein
MFDTSVASGGKFFKDFGARGRNLLQFQGPSGVAIYEDNNLMVICDQSNHRIQVHCLPKIPN